MVDIETNGTDMFKDDIFQIGILECIKNSKGFYIPARTFTKLLNTEQDPHSDWIVKHHTELIKKCKATPYESPTEVRAQILNFFKGCGVDKPSLMGLNALTFDIPFLYKWGYLKPEDHHYRTYELTGAYLLAQDGFQIERAEMFKTADAFCDFIELPEGNAHEALYDCYQQLKTLNGLIAMIRND